MRFLGIFVLLGCWLVNAPGALAYEFKHTPDTGRIFHWKRSALPVKLYLDQQGVPGVNFTDVQAAAQASASAWNINCGLSPLLNMQGTKQGITGSPKNDGTNLVIFVTDAAAWPHDKQQLAVTTHYFNLVTGEIQEADLVINAWNFQWGINAESTKYDVQAMLTHEYGHILGLDHTGVRDAAMFPSALPGETTKRNLHQDDKDAICNLYPKQPCQEGAETGAGTFCYNGRVTRLCSEYHQTCKPCDGNNQHLDCRGAKNFCLQLNEGTFCGSDCSETKNCPGGYVCTPVKDANNVTLGFNCISNKGQCTGVEQFPCCQKDDHCLPPYKCIGGSCLKQAVCVKESEACSQQTTCCGNLGCVNDGTGPKCRAPCDPLNPQCAGNLRCNFADQQDFSKGFCVPPRNGGVANADCSDQKPCEYELACHPRDNKCRYVCRPGQAGTCPSGHRCIERTDVTPKIGLCEIDSGGKSCKTADECATGQVCRNGQCNACSQDTECPSRHKCSNGACLAQCQDSTTCPRQHKCSNGLCEPSTTCTFDKDCGQGLVCQAGTCRPASSGTCTTNNDCQNGFTCVAGKCQDPCNNKCTSQENCVASKCVPKSCTSNSQCGQGLICHDSTCKVQDTNCGGAGPCPAGQICVNSKCKSPLGSGCSGDETCASGICATGGTNKFCSQTCRAGQATDCLDGYACTELPNITLGCWPLTYADCSESGKCVPKKEGCGCSASSTPSNVPPFLLLLLALVIMRRSLRKRLSTERKSHA